MAQPTVLVAGITGMLGAKIVEALLAGGAHVRALVRSLEPGGEKQRVLAGWQERGVTLVEGDVMAPDRRLDAAAAGADAVVSAVSNDPGLIVEGQTNLLRAAERQGVKRFIPSDFSVDYRKLDFGDNDNLDQRKSFLPVLQQSRVAHTLVLQGAFTEMLLTPFFSPYDRASHTFRYWGDGTTLMDFTTVEDTARYVAATVVDPRTENQALLVAGDQVNYRQIAEAFEAATGKALKPESQGTSAELRAWIDEKKRTANNAWEYLGQQYQWAMITGKGKLDPVQNSLYPEVRPATVRSYLAAALA
ncbi:MAG TPA: aromatic alcohol reductase [Solibacterales bacterium]|nr:aromatic alcohol reductase [Bryobacterales bacterium]